MTTTASDCPELRTNNSPTPSTTPVARAAILCPMSAVPAALVPLIGKAPDFECRYISSLDETPPPTLEEYDLAVLVDRDPHGPDAGGLDIGKINRLVAALKSARIGALVLTERPWLFTDSDVHWVCVPFDTPSEVARGAMLALGRLRPIVRRLAADRASIQLVSRRMHRHLEELDYELRLAARLQSEFLPHDAPAIGPVSFATMYRPTSFVSGDIFDLFRLDEAHLGFYLADAVGHGVAAGLLTMFIKHAIRPKRIHENSYEIFRPSHVISHLNDHLAAQGLPDSQFVTAWYGVLNIKTLVLEYAVAGHPPPFLLNPDGSVEELVGDGCLLGVFPNQPYRDYTARLRPGQRVLLYSDGLELMLIDERRPGAEMPVFQEGIVEMLARPTPRLVEELGERLDTQPGGLVHADDCSALLLEISSAPEHSSTG